MIDLHVHTCYCDGHDSPEQMVLSAIDRGVTTLGIVAHSYVPFDEQNCIALDREDEFIDEISRLKDKYRDSLTIYCGSERDYYATSLSTRYDYYLASVHYIYENGKYYSVDISAEGFVRMAQEAFGGDYYALCERYYDMVSSLADRGRVDVIGHLDLVTKFNDGCKYFDTTHPRYVRAWQSAVDKLLPLGVPFEVNIGGISRGYKARPYLEQSILDYIKERGGKLILSSDAHRVEHIAYEYDKWRYLLD